MFFHYLLLYLSLFVNGGCRQIRGFTVFLKEIYWKFFLGVFGF